MPLLSVAFQWAFSVVVFQHETNSIRYLYNSNIGAFFCYLGFICCQLNRFLNKALTLLYGNKYCKYKII